jgi:hypothetical protein
MLEAYMLRLQDLGGKILRKGGKFLFLSFFYFLMSSLSFDSEKFLIINSQMVYHDFIKGNEIGYTKINVEGSFLRSKEQGFYITNDSLYDRLNENVNLKELKLVYCNISSIHDKLCNNINIESLTLDVNQISTANRKLSRLTKLKTLSLRYNNITSIESFSKALKGIKNLTELSFANNKIREIPKCMKEIPNLTYLYLDDNLIEGIPCFLSQKDEFELHVIGNKIKDIPCCFNRFYKKYFILAISGNPVVTVHSCFEESVIPLNNRIQIE